MSDELIARGADGVRPGRYGDERQDDDPELVERISELVWQGMAGNGTFRLDIDTDVLWAYDEDNVNYVRAYDWVRYFVRSTIKHLSEASRG
jgi:hypothetical protein